MFVSEHLCFLLLSDIDECQNGPVCQQNAACLNMPGSYRCECKPGYRFTPTGQCLGKAVVVIRDVKGVGRSQMMQYLTGVRNSCGCSLNQQKLSQILLTSVEIIQNRWNHAAGLEKRLKQAAKKLLSSSRVKLTYLDLLEALAVVPP